MPATRVLPTEEATALLELTREIATARAPPDQVTEAEATETFPREVFRTLGRAGLLGLPYPEEYGGGGQPYEVYLQVVEEIATVWASVGVGVSVHALSCFGLVTRGTEEQRQKWLPDMLSGELLGAYCLSEAHAGSDPSAMKTRARRDGDEYVINGAKAWTTHGGHADFYKVMARTSDERNGISCFLVPADTEGLAPTRPSARWGSPVPRRRRCGSTTYASPPSGSSARRATASRSRSPASTPAAWASPPSPSGSARRRSTTRSPTPGSASSSASRSSSSRAWRSCSPTWRRRADARAMTLHAARLKDRGLPFSREASIAKLTATDTAMKVTTDAVQVLGGYGYTRDFPVERFMREAKVTQIFEGTNQIQRMVIGRSLGKDSGGSLHTDPGTGG